MSKLHAQMALLGTIDEIVCRGKLDAKTVKMVEGFLPGTTGVGQQGWYRELKHFLQRDELLPHSESGDFIERSASVALPSYADALGELASEPRFDEQPPSPGLQSRALYAATILSAIATMEGGTLPLPPGPDDSEHVPDPLDVLVPTLTRSVTGPLPPMPNDDSSTSSGADAEPAEAMTQGLRGLRSRADYVNFTQGLVDADHGALAPELRDVLARPVVCTGSLRRIDGRYSTLLTTRWRSPFTVSQLREVIDPHNWPQLCDFFVSMTDQPEIQPDPSRGWSRVLESVSGDRTQWEMRTALRFWNGVTSSGNGIYVNYDLDHPRVGDCGLVEVDAGYISAIPVDPSDPNSTVIIRTSKQVRIRGVSPTATAALGCGFGWGDAMSQMFTNGVDNPPPDRKSFVASTDPGPVKVTTTNAETAKESDAEIAAAAEDVELLDGWRGAIIEAMRMQLTAGIDTAQRLGSEFAVQWSDGDGFSLEDVKEFGADSGRELTHYVAGIFTAAAAALQPQSNGADANAEGGNH